MTQIRSTDLLDRRPLRDGQYTAEHSPSREWVVRRGSGGGKVIADHLTESEARTFAAAFELREALSALRRLFAEKCTATCMFESERLALNAAEAALARCEPAKEGT